MVTEDPRTTIDKSDWGDGPWQHEPDELIWNYGDIECRLVRHPRSGTLNGYVGLPPSHPWVGMEYDEIDVDVHGGLTFAGQFAEGTFATATNEHLYYVGFDCHHGMDRAPGADARWRELEAFDCLDGAETYRTVEYVQAEAESLARKAVQAMNSQRVEAF